MEKYKYCVIGSGPNSLSLLFYLYKNFNKKDILCLEKNKVLNTIQNYPNIIWHSPMSTLIIGENSKINDNIKFLFGSIASRKNKEVFIKNSLPTLIKKIKLYI